MQASLWLFYYCGAFGVRLDYFLLFLLFGVAMWSSWCWLSHDLVVAVNSEAFFGLTPVNSGAFAIIAFVSCYFMCNCREQWMAGNVLVDKSRQKPTTVFHAKVSYDAYLGSGRGKQ